MKEKELPFRKLVKKYGVIKAIDIKYPFLWLDLETWTPIVSLVSLIAAIVALTVSLRVLS
ncbi:hypothetical protein [Peptoniphilus asaccharolyticus]